MEATSKSVCFILLALMVAAGPSAAQEDEPSTTPPPKAQPEEKKEKEKGKETEKDKDKKKAAVDVREDRIKSVQKKSFLKNHRWELNPLVCLSLNDAFFQKVGGGVSAAFHLADNLGLEFQAVYVGTIETDMVMFFSKANLALPKESHLRYYLLGDVLWSPIYGKLSMFTDDIVMFDAYLIGGFGMAYTETGAKLATNIGLGLRYFLNSWLVVKVEIRDLIYTETLRLDMQRTQFSDVQNHLMLGAGVSFFFPTDFEYEYQ